MILSKEQIQKIIIDNPNKDLIAEGRRYNKTMRLHIYGEGIQTHLVTIEGFETAAVRELRAKYAKSNKDLFARLSRPVDKVFSATGGSTYYNLGDSQDKNASNYTNNLKGGFNTKKWVENFWKPHFLDDPFGIVFMEIDPDGNVYPTYKAITSIYDYSYEGTALDYVVFEISKKDSKLLGFKDEDKIYRVVDDMMDYLVKREGEKVSIIPELSYPNFFGRVPGLINSDIIDPSKEGFLSLYDEIIHLADDFLLTGSIRTTHKFLHGFPKYWEYADDCNKCQGTKYVGADPCTDCKGTGKKIMTKVSDVKLLTTPQTNQDATITPHVAGYVEPSEIYHNISGEELSTLEDAMNFTLWGKSNQSEKPNVKVAEKSATQVLDEVKPEESRLTPISESAEKRHKFIVDCIVEAKIRKGYIEAGGSSVNYGRRYMLENADALWERYQTARLKGASISVLDDLLMEFIETKYSGDPVSMAIQVKLLKLEPFVHQTVQQVEALQSVKPEDKATKVYFSEWLGTMNEAMILSFSFEYLKDSLVEYCADKVVEPEVKETKIAA